MGLRILRSILIIGLALVPWMECNLSEGETKPVVRSPVYFPALPDAFSEDFGIKVSRQRGSKSLQSIEEPLPTSSPKPTTTTEKLPLAQESHVANYNFVTEPPGPTYLTDSVYYHLDSTPSPVSEDGKSHSHGNDISEDDLTSSENREGESLGVFLQSVSAYKPEFLGDRIAFDPLINPASIHYIPIYSVEIETEPTTAKPSKSEPHTVSTTVYKRPLVTTEKTTETPPSTPSSSYRRPAETPKIRVPSRNRGSSNTKVSPPSTPSSRYRNPTKSTTTTPSTRYRIPTTTPPRYVTPDTPASQEEQRTSSTIKPRLRYKAPATRILRTKKPSPKLEPQPETPTRTIALRPKYNPIPPVVVKTEGFLPKAAPNPFEFRISKPVVEPVYETPKDEPAPKRKSVDSTSASSSNPPAPTRPSRNRSSAIKKASSTRGSSGTSFGERKQKKEKTLEIYRPQNAKSSEDSLEQLKSDFSFDFDSPSESEHFRQYRPAFIANTQTEEAPVYRTSTKAYRAPSSLYQVRRNQEKVVTAPSQPDFIQTDSNIYVPHEYDENAIPGDAGIDYPIYSTIPDTRFACSDQDNPGLYADTETNCQVFHICQEGGREDSFLCPNGTVFNQQYFVCDWWYNFSCDHAERFYSLNALIYELSEVEDNRKRPYYS